MRPTPGRGCRSAATTSTTSGSARGSTGTPKGIAISQRGARAAILGNTWVMSTSAPVAAPRTLQVAPLVYAGGWSVFPTLLRGGTNVVAARFDADETIADDRVREHRLDVRGADHAAADGHLG